MKYLSLFSGIGGFEYGMQQSKHEFEAIGFSEVDKYATSIYLRHFPRHRELGDVKKINTGKLEDFELLVGGFPCQAFSIAGKRRGFDDTRGTLFFEIARVLKDCQPRYFLLENVKGLLSHDRGRTIQTILRVCNELGYDVSWKIYNSKDYDVPQNRERIFIKGFLREKCRREILHFRRENEQFIEKKQKNKKIKRVGNFSPTNHHGGDIYDANGLCPTLLHDSVVKNGLHIVEKDAPERKLIKLNEAAQAQTIYSSEGIGCSLSSCAGGDGGKTGLYKVNVVGNLSPSNHHAQDIMDTEGVSKTLLATDYKHPKRIIEPKIKKVYGSMQEHRAETDGSYSPCLTSMAASNSNRPMVEFEDYRVRRLTPVECERLQGFPDNWTKLGKNGELISDAQRYKCLGNAVTTNVITHIFNNWDLQE